MVTAGLLTNMRSHAGALQVWQAVNHIQIVSSHILLAMN